MLVLNQSLQKPAIERRSMSASGVPIKDITKVVICYITKTIIPLKHVPKCNSYHIAEHKFCLGGGPHVKKRYTNGASLLTTHSTIRPSNRKKNSSLVGGSPRHHW